MGAWLLITSWEPSKLHFKLRSCEIVIYQSGLDQTNHCSLILKPILCPASLCRTNKNNRKYCSEKAISARGWIMRKDCVYTPCWLMPPTPTATAAWKILSTAFLLPCLPVLFYSLSLWYQKINHAWNLTVYCKSVYYLLTKL